MINLTIGKCLTQEEHQDLCEACYVTVGRTARFDMPDAARAILATYSNTLDSELVYQSLDVHKGQWRYWNGRYWQAYDRAQLIKDLMKILPNELDAAKAERLERTMEGHASRPWSSFDQDDVMVLRNCCLKVEGKKIGALAFAKEHLRTYEVPVKLKSGPTPHWQAMLDKLLPDKLDQQTLQELFGYTFFHAVRAQVLFLLHGDAATGKSTVINVLCDMLGLEKTSAVSASSLHLPHGTAPLETALLNVDSESEYIAPEDEVILKKLTGNDPVLINKKFLPAYPAHLPVRWVMICNTLPKFHDKTSGLWSRLVVIPFTQVVPEGERKRGDELLKLLRPEYGGIVHWALKGIYRILAKGTRATAFTQSETAKELLANHQIFSNPFLDWYEQYAQPEPEETTDKTLAYDHYKNWCSRYNYKAVAENTFAKFLRGRGHQDARPGPRPKPGHETRTRVWQGLRLLPRIDPYATPNGSCPS